jgi:hypothetical protein
LSERSSVKLWTTDQQFNFAKDPSNFAAASSSAPTSGLAALLKRNPSPVPPLRPVLVGEMWVHSSCVNNLIALSPFAFASCGSDHLIILWKVPFRFNSARA